MGALLFHIRPTYDRLVPKLGFPIDGPDRQIAYKTTCEWIVGRDGTPLKDGEADNVEDILFSVCDWKEGTKTIRGQYAWHVTGAADDLDAIRKKVKDLGLELPLEQGEMYFRLAKLNNGTLKVEKWTNSTTSTYLDEANLFWTTTSTSLGEVARSWTHEELYSIYEAHGHPREMFRDESVSVEEAALAAQVLSSACFAQAPTLKRKRSE